MYFSANGTIQTQTVQSQVRTSAGIQQHPQQQQTQQPQGGQLQPQQIRLATAGAQGAQQLVTLAGGQQIAVQMQPQVMQFPTAASTQQTMMQTVQIPVSQVSFFLQKTLVLQKSISFTKNISIFLHYCSGLL